MPKSYNTKSGAYVVHSLNKGSSTPYLLAQIKMGDGALHVQVRCPKYPGKNRPYGFSFDVKMSPMVAESYLAMQTWCTTGALTEPETDAQEHAEVVKSFVDHTPKCGECGDALCVCGQCHKCKHLDSKGKPIKDAALKEEMKVDTIVDEEDDEEEEEKDNPKCKYCLSERCSNCGKCHSCHDLNENCERICPECENVLCGECGNCHYCNNLNDSCDEFCPECENELCHKCSYCHNCKHLDDECDPILEEPSHTDEDGEPEFDLVSDITKALAEHQAKLMDMKIQGELGKMLSGVKFIKVGNEDIFTPEALEALSKPDKGYPHDSEEEDDNG